MQWGYTEPHGSETPRGSSFPLWGTLMCWRHHRSLGFYKVQRCFLGDLRSCRTQSYLDGGWGSAGHRDVSFENGDMQAFSCSFFGLGNQIRAGCSIIWDVPCDFIGMSSVYQRLLCYFQPEGQANPPHFLSRALLCVAPGNTFSSH